MIIQKISKQKKQEKNIFNPLEEKLSKLKEYLHSSDFNKIGELRFIVNDKFFIDSIDLLCQYIFKDEIEYCFISKYIKESFERAKKIQSEEIYKSEFENKENSQYNKDFPSLLKFIPLLLNKNGSIVEFRMEIVLNRTLENDYLTCQDDDIEISSLLKLCTNYSKSEINRFIDQKSLKIDGSKVENKILIKDYKSHFVKINKKDYYFNVKRIDRDCRYSEIDDYLDSSNAINSYIDEKFLQKVNNEVQNKAKEMTSDIFKENIINNLKNLDINNIIYEKFFMLMKEYIKKQSELIVLVENLYKKIDPLD